MKLIVGLGNPEEEYSKTRHNMGFDTLNKIAKEYGCGLVYAEMVSDKAICFKNVKTLGMLGVDENEHPMSMQVFGGDKESIVEAAKFIDQNTNCDISICY